MTSDLGFPGEFPFTRGIQPTMYRGRLWTMRQYAGFGTAIESNRRYRYLLEQGVNGLSVAFDLPTQMGYDSDHPLAQGEVGRVGVAIDSIEDMAVLFAGIPLDRVSTSMTINATAIILLALYVAVARRQNMQPAKLAGTIQNDILKEYVARGTYIYPPRASLRIVTDIFAFCERELPQWNTISISGYHIREAGATAVQEVAFTFANGIAYVQAAIEAGLDVNRFGQRLSFFFNAHNNFLEEIAKFRAARRLWARIMRDRFGATNPRAQQLRFHAQTAGSTLTAQQPDNNIVRVAIQAMAAVLGGAQSLHCNGRDEALALPTESAARLALRTQQIIASETGVPNTVDPVGGAYAIEKLTDGIEASAEALIDRMDRGGGTLSAIESGLIQREIQESAYRAQQAIDAGDAVVVGVNRFTETGGKTVAPDLFRIDPELEAQQVERVRLVRAGRSHSAWEQAMGAVSAAAHDGGNLVPRIISAVEAGATVGEISDAMRAVFGEDPGSGRILMLEVSHLTTVFDLASGPAPAVSDVTFEIRPGETLGLVGESGSGKSVTALSIMRLVEAPGRIASGRVSFKGRNLLDLPEADMQAVRGADIGFVFQEPMTALNPVFTIGSQIAETLLVHGRATRREARAHAIDLLGAVQIPNPSSRVDDYPHQLSGGMRQRALIAMAIACKPSLLIADEPTTALDVTIQAEILDLLREMKGTLNLSMLLITHDLGVIAETADSVAVMYAGRIVEYGPVAAIFREPQHPYTQGLLASMPGTGRGRRLKAIEGGVPVLGRFPSGCAFHPRCPERFEPCAAEVPPLYEVGDRHVARCYLHDPSARDSGNGPMPLVEVSHLVKQFVRGRGLFRRSTTVTAVDDVSFGIEAGETFGLVGESGSGKTTTGRCILRLIEPTSGAVRFQGEDVLALPPRELRERRRDMQIVFQDPYSSLNPRMRARQIVEEPLIIHRRGNRTWRRDRVAELFHLVGLDPAHLERRPHQFSGGQRQRIGLARALALNPSFLILDEPVSALDVSVQAQVINLLMDLQQALKLTYLFIAHDLRLVEHICTRVAVMYLGKIVEVGPAAALFDTPHHPYTRALLSAIPIPDPDARRQRVALDPAALKEHATLREVGPQHWAAV